MTDVALEGLPSLQPGFQICYCSCGVWRVTVSSLESTIEVLCEHELDSASASAALLY